jgi:hypothetical protein
MVYLGYMLPTNEEDEKKIQELSKIYEVSVERILHQIITNEYRRMK